MIMMMIFRLRHSVHLPISLYISFSPSFAVRIYNHQSTHEVFPRFFLSCKVNVRVQPAKTGHCPHFPNFCFVLGIFLCYSMYFCVLCIVCFVSFTVLFLCICVLYYCHRVATQLQLNISYHFLFPPVTGLLMAAVPLYIVLFSVIMGSQNILTLTSGVLNRIWPHTRNSKTCTVTEIPRQMGFPLNVRGCGDEYAG
jgi:hypothetical protein